MIYCHMLTHYIRFIIYKVKLMTCFLLTLTLKLKYFSFNICIFLAGLVFHTFCLLLTGVILVVLTNFTY